MKTGRSKKKNMIVSHGIDGSRAAKLLKEAWLAFRSLLKSSPNLIKMDAAKLKDIHVMDHLLGRKKRRSNHDGINFLMNSKSIVPKLDHLSQDTSLHEAAASHNNNTSFSLQPSLMMERIRDGVEVSGSSGGYSVSNAVNVEEVDQVADAFISRFYSNMRLEKQRSYKSYQEMLARGM